MNFTSGGWRSWLLFFLAAVVVGSYFGILGPVQERLERLAKAAPIARAANQPMVAETFKDPVEGRMDAYVVVFLFVFLSPLALFMAVALAIFLLSALSSMLGPVMGGEKVAMLILAIAGCVVVYVEREVWLPHAAYFLGLLARAYVVIVS